MKKVLSLDGGGIKGYLASLVLEEVQSRLGRPLVECFDLISGTSTGGIIALMLACGYAPAEISAFYRDEGPAIFGKKGFTRGFLGPKYDHRPLEKILRAAMGDICLSKAKAPTMIPTYDLLLRRPFFWKSWEHQVPMRDIARATSAAETFFSPHSLIHGGAPMLLADGGTCANNPAMCAAVETTLLCPGEDITVFSVGTGQNTRKLKAHMWGALQWVVKGAPIINVFMDGQSDVVDYQLKRLLESRHIRLQTELKMASDDMDDASPENMLRLHAEAEEMIIRETESIGRLCSLLQEKPNIQLSASA